MNLCNLLCMLPLPDAGESTTSPSASSDSLQNLSLSAVLGPDYIQWCILDFRGFFLQIVAVDNALFSTTLSKADAINTALVLMISLWIKNYIASQTTVTLSDIQAAFESIFERSIKVMAILSIAAQVDLAEHPFTKVLLSWLHGSGANCCLVWLLFCHWYIVVQHSMRSGRNGTRG